jgi:release factor glutamine methyltransferase
MADEIWTVTRLLDWTTEYLKKNQIEDPHLEAEILLSRALNSERIKLYIDFEKVIDKKTLATFKGCIIRRAKGEPSAYITGNKQFMSLNFIVTKDVLIPRPETELLVENAIELSKKIGGKAAILDIGTGSGAIAVSMAKFIENSEIVATDLSEKALEVAALNAKKHDVEGKIKFVKADLFPEDIQKFDIIVSNPPYIKTALISGLQREVKDFEPLSALDGGADGLTYYRAILDKAPEYLKENGSIILEISPELAKDVISLAKNAFKTKDNKVIKDLNALDRVIVLQFHRKGI